MYENCQKTFASVLNAYSTVQHYKLNNIFKKNENCVYLSYLETKLKTIEKKNCCSRSYAGTEGLSMFLIGKPALLGIHF